MSENLSLERVLTHPGGVGLDTATPLQRAICRAADGQDLGELWEVDAVRKAFGNAPPDSTPPHMMCVGAGIRGAKSLIAATKAICGTQNVDISHCSPGDEIRLPVLSTEVDLAHAIFGHIKGALLHGELLNPLLIGTPKSDSVQVRHPSGRAIEIKVTAMSRAGTTLVARWLAGCVFDEAPRMLGDGSVKSLNESLRAIQGRMLPGSQIWCIGSPWAPFGPFYDLDMRHFGNPTKECVFIRAPGPDLNPYWWTQDRIDRVRQIDPDAYKRDVLAEYADPKDALISSAALKQCTREEMDAPPVDGIKYVAFMDPATRRNAWTLIVLGCTGRDDSEMPCFEVSVAKEWIGSPLDPLRPREVLKETARILKPYGLTECYTDQYSIDANMDLADLYDLELMQEDLDNAAKLDWARQVSLLLVEERLSVPPDPHLRSDLLSAQRRPTQNGVSLVLPVSGDDRHCDYLSALIGAVSVHPEAPDLPAERGPQDPLERMLDRLQEPTDPWERAAGKLLV